MTIVHSWRSLVPERELVGWLAQVTRATVCACAIRAIHARLNELPVDASVLFMASRWL